MLRRRSLLSFLVTAIVLCLFTSSDGLFAQGRRDAAFERVREVQQRHSERMLAKAGVVGTATGQGQALRPTMLVLVEHGAVAGIPDQLDGVPVRPLVTGRIYALAKGGKPGRGKGKPGTGQMELDPTSRWPRAVPIGVSAGHPALTTGTLGCRVRDEFGNVYALSNNHVYANQNQADIGNAILQPGTYDGGVSPVDDIGTLFDFEPIVFSTSAANVIDAAIALSSSELIGDATPADGYGLPKSTTAIAPIGAKVMKYGRTTGQTSAKVRATNVIVNVQYDAGVARFVDQILIGGGNFSDGGDSGSLVVLSDKGEDNRKPVGLLFAGAKHFTLANPIDAVLTRFGVTIDGE